MDTGTPVKEELRPSLRPSPTFSRKSYWRPLFLRTVFWAPMVVVILLVVVALQVSLRYSNTHSGWPVTGKTKRQTEAVQYLYHLPPVIGSMILVAVWANTDIEIQRVQPYLALTRGHAPASQSVLLDYSRFSLFLLPLAAYRNRHYFVLTGSLLSLLVLAFNPLASVMFAIGEIPVTEPSTQVNNLAILGLNSGDPRFQDLTVFMTAAGFSGAAVQYNLPDPPWTSEQWTVAPFSLPQGITLNGTATAQTTAVRSTPNCQQSATMVTAPIPAGLTNNATTTNCTSSWDVDQGTPTAFEAFNAVCDGEAQLSVSFQQVSFWYYTSQPTKVVTAIFCAPALELWNVTATVDIATGAVRSLVPLQQVNNVPSLTGSPTNGHAYNGVEWDANFPQDFFSLQRQNATRLQLPAAVLQMAATTGNFSQQAFANLTTSVYGEYLKTLAKSVYFAPTTSETITVAVTTIQTRGWLLGVSVHITTALLIILAFTAAMLHVKLREERHQIFVLHSPGTIAAATTLTAGTELAKALEVPSDRGLEETLRGKMFSFDKDSHKIVIDPPSAEDLSRSPLLAPNMV